MVDFLGKVKQGIDKGVTVVTVKSKEMVEVSKKKNQLSFLREQRGKALFEMGEMIFQMYLQNGLNEEKIRTKCETVALLGSRIMEKELELKQLHVKAEEALGKNFCTFCETELAENAIYCSKCGERVDMMEKN